MTRSDVPGASLARRIRQAIEDAGYEPMSDQSMVDLARRLVAAYPKPVKLSSVRRYPYRWSDEKKPKGLSPLWARTLAQVLDLPVETFVVPRNQQAQVDLLVQLEVRLSAAEAEIAQLRSGRAEPKGGRGGRPTGRRK